MNKKFTIISKEEIEESLNNSTRQYLVGLLERPQFLNNLEDKNIEIGITSYKEYTVEKPHTHTHNTEFQYIIDGYTICMDVETRKEYHLKKGDFYRVEPGFKSAQKSAANTTILFVKSPRGNDKVVIDADEYTKNWYKDKIYRMM